MPIANDLARIGTHDAVRFLNSHRIFFYALVSLLSVFVVITNALKNYSNFYSVSIFLSKSSRSVLVLANFGVLLTLLCGHIVQRIFFGTLRPNEVERLYDRLWFFITESLLAFTIFRDEFDTPFALMFGFLLFVKSFHWLASDRIEWMDQRPYPGPPLLFHLRMTTLFTILWATDFLMFLFAVEHTLSVGVGGMVLFASEYGILMASIMNTIFKYLLSAYDLRRAGRRGGENAPPWENKSMWTFYIELTTDFLKLTTYLIFFIIIISWYGLPLNIVRDVYITARSFITRLRALHRYQTATRNMDQRYPNASEEELTAMSDRTCIICREEMVLPGAQDVPAQPDGPNTTPKKLPCGHIFHFHCLRSWLERQQSCPTCRRNVLDETNNTQAAGAAIPGQPPNAPGGPQGANQQGPRVVNGQNIQGGNNPLGLIGRFFGPPARLANPAQPNRQTLQNNMANQGQAGQQPGIFINYQVQYQIPQRQNDEDPQPRRIPVPPYPGFQGPGGEWQHWPTDQGLESRQSSETPPLDQTEVTSSETSFNLRNIAGPDRHSPSADQSEDHSDSQAGLQTPREAAAQAALRRFGSQNSASKVPTREPVSTPGSADLRTPSQTSIGTVKKPTPTTATPEPSTSTTSTSITNSVQNNQRPPQLIPLLDFGSYGANVTPGPTLSSEQSWTQNQTYRPFRERNLHQAGSHSAPSPRIPQGGDSFTPLSSQLPASLTDEQLATLDVLTRESIDERLRVLEGVSGAVYRCIDDLMRLRSALPVVDGTASATNGSSSQPVSATTVESTSQTGNPASVWKGKEKEKDGNPSSSGTLSEDQSSNSSTEQLIDI